MRTDPGAGHRLLDARGVRRVLAGDQTQVGRQVADVAIVAPRRGGDVVGAGQVHDVPCRPVGCLQGLHLDGALVVRTVRRGEVVGLLEVTEQGGQVAGRGVTQRRRQVGSTVHVGAALGRVEGGQVAGRLRRGRVQRRKPEHAVDETAHPVDGQLDTLRMGVHALLCQLVDGPVEAPSGPCRQRSSCSVGGHDQRDQRRRDGPEDRARRPAQRVAEDVERRGGEAVALLVRRDGRADEHGIGLVGHRGLERPVHPGRGVEDACLRLGEGDRREGSGREEIGIGQDPCVGDGPLAQAVGRGGEPVGQRPTAA